MSRNHDDEFVAVRVQDPRIHNEGSWNSFVDYKIFLHTNSKAFTAKTSCVRRRYSEFVWLKKKLQKNAGLVPVPDLPGKSFFSFTNEDFLERRRKGLQAFLDKVLHMTVCLSDSQLHLFLQTQLPVGHIEDCVRGHTPYTVTEAILTYASSNWGLAQAQAQTQEDDSMKEPSLTISYESMESPAPHQASLQSEGTLTSCEGRDPLASLLDPVEFQHKRNSSVKVYQRNNHLEAVVECDTSSIEATFFLGDSPSEQESVDLADSTLSRSGQIQTPVEVHSPMEGGPGQDFGLEYVREESMWRGEGGEANVLMTKEEEIYIEVRQPDNSDEVKGEDSVVILDSGNDDAEEQADQIHPSSTEKVGFSNKPLVENHLTCEANHTDDTKVPDADMSHMEELDEEQHFEDQECDKSESSGEVEGENDGAVLQIKQNCAEQGLDSLGTVNESEEDKHSLPSSNESIMKVSDEDSSCEETKKSVGPSPQNISHWSEVEAPNKNILDLQLNGCFVENEDISGQDDEDLQYMSSTDFTSTEACGDCSENSDFSILESSCTSGRTEGKRTEEQTLSVLSLDTAEETHEVEVC